MNLGASVFAESMTRHRGIVTRARKPLPGYALADRAGHDGNFLSCIGRQMILVSEPAARIHSVKGRKVHAVSGSNSLALHWLRKHDYK